MARVKIERSLRGAGSAKIGWGGLMGEQHAAEHPPPGGPPALRALPRRHRFLSQVSFPSCVDEHYIQSDTNQATVMPMLTRPTGQV